MGNRSYLHIYLEENHLDKDEARYYHAYCNQSFIGNEDKLVKLAKEVETVWNQNFTYMPNQMPTTRLLQANGKTYFSPDSTFSKEEDLEFSRKDKIPESFYLLFSPSDLVEGEYVFQSTSVEALKRIDRVLTTDALADNPVALKEIEEMKAVLNFIPDDSWIECQFAEVMDEELESYLPLKYYLGKMID